MDFYGLHISSFYFPQEIILAHLETDFWLILVLLSAPRPQLINNSHSKIRLELVSQIRESNQGKKLLERIQLGTGAL